MSNNQPTVISITVAAGGLSLVTVATEYTEEMIEEVLACSKNTSGGAKDERGRISFMVPIDEMEEVLGCIGGIATSLPRSTHVGYGDEPWTEYLP